MTYDKLRASRVVRGIKLRALAARIGVQPWTLCKWEAKTRTPSEEERRRWEKELKRLVRETT